MEPSISRPVKRVRHALSVAFIQIRRKVIARLRDVWAEKQLGKASDNDALIDQIVEGVIDSDDFLFVQQLITPELRRQFTEGGYQQIVSMQVADDESIVELLDKDALAYADKRGAELVGRRVRIDDDGVRTVIDNPNPQWSITDSTRELIRNDVRTGVEEGWSSERLASEIEDNYAFSSERAYTVARTELAFAHVGGHKDVAGELGAIGKRSILGSEHDHDVPDGDVCDECAERGVIPIDEEFAPGHDTAPYHPNCVCDTIFVYDGDEDAAELGKTDTGEAKWMRRLKRLRARRDPLGLEQHAPWAKSDLDDAARAHQPLTVLGFNIIIENAAGTRRKPEFPPMQAHYGYFIAYTGADGDELDVFVKPGTDSTWTGPVFVVHQVRTDGSFDEDKVLLGWESADAARAGYLANYTAGWRMGEMSEFEPDAFRAWVAPT